MQEHTIRQIEEDKMMKAFGLKFEKETQTKKMIRKATISTPVSTLLSHLLNKKTLEVKIKVKDK
jgi:hypothetical protein